MAAFTVGQRVGLVDGVLQGEKATIIKIDEQNWPGYVCIQFDRRNAHLGREHGYAILSDQWYEQDRIKAI
jgi:hypothetical protein